VSSLHAIVTHFATPLATRAKRKGGDGPISASVSASSSATTAPSSYFKPTGETGGGTSLAHVPKIDGADVTTLFFRIDEIRKVNVDLLAAVQPIVDADREAAVIGPVFLRFIPMLSPYSSYAQHYPKALTTLVRLSRDAKFATFLDTQPKLHGLGSSLQSLLIMPIQRIPRYRLLLQELVRVTPAEHPDAPHLAAAVDQISALADAVNESIREQENFSRVVEIASSFTGPNSNTHTIVQEGRRFIADGLLMKVCKKVHKPRHIFVFHDLFVYGTPRPDGTFKFSAQFPLEDVLVRRVDPAKMPEGVRFAFEVRSPSKSFALFTETEAEMQRWIDMLEPLTGSHTAALDLKMGAAPVWQQNTDNCQACAVKFTLTTRTHHCRHCGRCVCDKCSRRRIHLRPADRKPSRVCDDCAASFGSVIGVGASGAASSGAVQSKGSGVKGRAAVSMRAEPEASRNFMDELSSKVSGRAPGSSGSTSVRLTTSGSGIRMASSPPRSPRQGSLTATTGSSPNSVGSSPFLAAAPGRGGARSPRSPRGASGALTLGRARGVASPPPVASTSTTTTTSPSSTARTTSPPQRRPPVVPTSAVPLPPAGLPSFESSSDDSFDDSDSDEDAPPLPTLPPPARPAVTATMNLYRAVRSVTTDQATGRLSLRVGECVQLVEKVSDRVWMGRRGDEEGLFPSDAVEPYASSGGTTSRRRSTRQSWKSMEQQLLTVPLPRLPVSAPPTRVSTGSQQPPGTPPPRPSSKPPRS